MESPVKIAVFASGNGSNFERLVEYSRLTGSYEVAALYCNNPSAYCLIRAEKLGIPSFLFDRKKLTESQEVIADLELRGIQWIVLAGFLWLIPDNILLRYQQRIVNIHPALLPKYGGKGMYGMKVHEAVIDAGEKESGITIHYVNSRYDEGQIIFQVKCAIDMDETPDSLAAKIHSLEYEYFPKIIERIIEG